MQVKITGSTSDCLESYHDSDHGIGDVVVVLITEGENWVDIAYETLRAAPNGDVIASWSHDLGRWVVGDPGNWRGAPRVPGLVADCIGKTFTDLTISFDA